MSEKVGEPSVREGQILPGDHQVQHSISKAKATRPAKLPGSVYPLQVVGTLSTLFASPLPPPSQCQPSQTGNKRAKAKWLGPAALTGMVRWCGNALLLESWADTACLAHGQNALLACQFAEETCIGRLGCALGALERGTVSIVVAGITQSSASRYTRRPHTLCA